MATTSLSKKLETSINKFFATFVIPNETVYNENIMYGGIMNKFIAIDKSSNKEIPTCCLRETLSSTIAYNNTVLHIPLHEITNRKSYKTAHMIFNNLVVQPSRAGTLQRIRTSSGKVYYGSYGLLLDENKNPILLSTVNNWNTIININAPIAKYINKLNFLIKPIIIYATANTAKARRAIAVNNTLLVNSGAAVSTSGRESTKYLASPKALTNM